MTSLQNAPSTAAAPTKARPVRRAAQVKPATEGWQQAKDAEGRPLLQFTVPEARQAARCTWPT